MSYDKQIKLMLGDCLFKLKELEDNSVDSIVTDPPYGLSFMGKHWDYDVPSQEIWEECLRVLKPGGYLLAFAGSRTYHRMAVRIEDVGFEIRDQIMWIYGSGFPKSLNISKQIDKQAGAVDANKNNKSLFGYGTEDITTPTTDAAKQWNGWGTALKPAHEPIVMARKPLSENTVSDNVLKYGTGGINIDGCRIATTDTLGGGATNGSGLDIDGFDRPWMHDEEKMKEYQQKMQDNVAHAENLGRFPANVIFDDDAGEILDEQSGISKSTGGSGEKSMGALGKNGKYGKYTLDVLPSHIGGIGDSGGASRFFYCPKTSKSERNEGLDGYEQRYTDTNRVVGSAGGTNPRNRGAEQPIANFHPTVKPTDLMAYLIRLVTHTGGTVLDPFMGSGSTGKAAVREGAAFIGIEMESEYFEIANGRINWEIQNFGKVTVTKKAKSTSNKLTMLSTETDFW